MNELQRIDGFHVKIYGTAENPLFLAKEIADLLEIKQASVMLKNVDEDEKVVNTIHISNQKADVNNNHFRSEDEKLKSAIFTSGQNRQMWFLTEDGLYEVLMTSRKPQAKLFKKKVKEILKSIRKHGAYLTDEAIKKTLQSPDYLIGIITALKEEREARLELEKENGKLNLELVEERERTRYLDLIFESKDDVLITQIAQDYDLSARELNKILKDLRIQRSVNRQWVLYRQYMGKGYIKSRTTHYRDSQGKAHTSLTTTWTQKGREFLYRKLKSAGYLPAIEKED